MRCYFPVDLCYLKYKVNPPWLTASETISNQSFQEIFNSLYKDSFLSLYYTTDVPKGSRIACTDRITCSPLQFYASHLLYFSFVLSGQIKAMILNCSAISSYLVGYCLKYSRCSFKVICGCSLCVPKIHNPHPLLKAIY